MHDALLGQRHHARGNLDRKAELLLQVNGLRRLGGGTGLRQLVSRTSTQEQRHDLAQEVPQVAQ